MIDTLSPQFIYLSLVENPFLKVLLSMCIVMKTNFYFKISVRSDYFEVKLTHFSLDAEDSRQMGYSTDFTGSWQS